MEMLDTKYAVSSHTLDEMEQLVFDLEDSYFLIHLLYCILDDMGFSFDFSSYRLKSLDVPFASSSMSRSFELGLSRLFDFVHAYPVLVDCVRNGHEFNFIPSDD